MRSELKDERMNTRHSDHGLKLVLVMQFLSFVIRNHLNDNWRSEIIFSVFGCPEKFREIYNFAFGWAKEKVWIDIFLLTLPFFVWLN